MRKISDDELAGIAYMVTRFLSVVVTMIATRHLTLPEETPTRGNKICQAMNTEEMFTIFRIHCSARFGAPSVGASVSPLVWPPLSGR